MGVGSEVHYEQTDDGDVLTDDSGDVLSLKGKTGVQTVVPNEFNEIYANLANGSIVLVDVDGAVNPTLDSAGSSDEYLTGVPGQIATIIIRNLSETDVDYQPMSGDPITIAAGTTVVVETIGLVEDGTIFGEPPAVPAERTVFTLGPDTGSYDIEWAAAENADAFVTDPPIFTLVDGHVIVEGEIDFTGANDSLGFALPVALRPVSSQRIPIYAYDDTAGINKVAFLQILVDGTVSIRIDHLTAWAADSFVVLSGSYLVAE